MRVVSVRPIDDGTKGLALVVGAGLLWAMVSPASRILGRLGADMATVVGVRQAVAALVLGGWCLCFRRESLRMDPKGFLIMSIFSLVGPLAANLGFMASLTTLSVPVGMVVHYTFPMMTVLGALLLTGEKPNGGEMTGALLIALAVFLTADPRGGAISLSGLSWGIVGALGMAIQSLFVRKVFGGKATSPAAFLFYSNLMGFFWLAGGRWLIMGDPLVALSREMSLWAVFLALIASCLAYGMFYEGMRFVSASSASLGVTIEIVGAVILTGAMLGEFPSMREVAGCSMIMCAIFVAALSSRRKH